MKRCPWYAEVIQRAAQPRSPFSAWVGTSLLFAGSNAWAMARPHRERGARAVTVLPPGELPASIEWPPVADWIVDAGDLPAGEAVEVGRCLIDCGARRVQMVGDQLASSLRLLRVE